MMTRIPLKGLRVLLRGGLLVAAMAVLLALPGLPGLGGDARAQLTITDLPLPEFTHQDPKLWVNTKPLKTADLKGKVVLVKVWTTI